MLGVKLPSRGWINKMTAVANKAAGATGPEADSPFLEPKCRIGIKQAAHVDIRSREYCDCRQIIWAQML